MPKEVEGRMGLRGVEEAKGFPKKCRPVFPMSDRIQAA
jgi:hypothetical protein